MPGEPPIALRWIALRWIAVQWIAVQWIAVQWIAAQQASALGMMTSESQIGSHVLDRDSRDSKRHHQTASPY